jgi:hypothetical protein
MPKASGYHNTPTRRTRPPIFVSQQDTPLYSPPKRIPMAYQRLPDAPTPRIVPLPSGGPAEPTHSLPFLGPRQRYTPYPPASRANSAPDPAEESDLTDLEENNVERARSAELPPRPRSVRVTVARPRGNASQVISKLQKLDVVFVTSIRVSYLDFTFKG